MNKIYVLDCTLRDGGYCNNWKFGSSNIKKIVNSLAEANIDIIECGYLTNCKTYEAGATMFTDMEQIERVINVKKKDRIYVAMINYGEYDITDIPLYNGRSIDGVRVAFHKKDFMEAINFSKGLKQKGYKVFVQPMLSLCYSDEEFLKLIDMVNDIEPYAFYIVDSFGTMNNKSLMRLFYITENDLNKDIYIGFHSHNNLQLALSNAQAIVNIKTKRNLIIDTSIYGMGRGAGNLNTELFLDYLNECLGEKYLLLPLLRVIDTVLGVFYKKNYWGYSLPNYLSAIYSTHPNYANYLSEKNTLTIVEMENIFSMISEEKRFEYDKDYIDQLYLQYMFTRKNHKLCHLDLEIVFKGKKILLIAPGKSSKTEKDSIIKFAKENDVIVMSINFEYGFLKTEYIFVSNLRRFSEISSNDYYKCIVTSNISVEKVFAHVDYEKLLCSIDTIKDNAGIMAIKFLIDMGADEIYLAGFDGYSYDLEQNYMLQELELVTGSKTIDSMNEGISEMLRRYRKMVKMQFITKAHYIDIN